MLNKEHAEYLRNMKIPEQMHECQNLINFLAGHVETLEPGAPPMTPEQGLQEINKLVPLMLSAQVELINAVSNIVESLKPLGQLTEVLKKLTNPGQ